MRDFETRTETRPVVKPIPRIDIGLTDERRHEYKQQVADVVQWYIEQDPERAAAVGGLGQIVRQVSQDVNWPTADVHNALRLVPGIDTNLADSTIRILEPDSEEIKV